MAYVTDDPLTVPALLWSEMHDTHRVLADRASQSRWKRPPRFATVDEIGRNKELLACAWLSDAALARLKKAGLLSR